MKKPFYLTTPLYYVNDVPHLGHAYTTIAADSLARYHKMCGEDVFFLTGTDEHGQKLERSASKAGQSPQEYVDRIVGRFQALWSELGIEYDDFIRTTQPRHKKGVLSLLERMKASGDLYKDSYEGWYCTGCEAFYPETQLENGHCPDGHDTVETLKEESWFFRLSKYEKPLLEHYDRHPEFIRPRARMNEIRVFVESGLRDLSVSRSSVSWGIPWPGDADHVLYVWLDALSNYITALGFGQEDDSRFQKFWPANVHLMAKEINRFHSVYWPAFLMSAGVPLPQQIFAHGWLLAEGRKMSKSFGNVLEPHAYLDTIGSEAVRYCLMRDVSFGQDGSFSDEGFIDRANADLANDLGNLVSRATKMIGDWCGGVVPESHGCKSERVLEEAAVASLAKFREAMDRLELHRALAACWELVSAANRFIDDQKPWALRKEESKQAHLGGVLYATAESLRWIACMIQPVMPRSGERIFGALGLTGSPQDLRYDELHWGGLQPGTSIGEREAIFPRLDKPRVMKRIGSIRQEKSVVSEQEQKPAEEKAEETKENPLVSIDQFQKIQLRVGKVLEADVVEGADKLLVMQVDLGDEKRQIVSGIRADYSAEDMVGRNVILVANLKPATIRGVRSQGMLLAAHDESGIVVAGFDRELSPGSPVT